MIDGHIELQDTSSDNWHLIDKPDMNFNREHNIKAIRKMLIDNWKRHNQVDAKVVENSGNIADILASFAKYKLDLDGGKQLEQWLGKSWMTKIYGEKLLEKIARREEIQRLNLARGNTMLNGNFYLK